MPIRLNSDMANEEISLTEKQIEVIQGCLLGDGGIFTKGNSSYFAYSSSQQEHVQYVWEQLKEYTTLRYCKGPVKSEVYDKRTGKTYFNFAIRTKSNIVFNRIWKNWYPNNKKHVPKNLQITNTVALFWYLGDGSLDKKDSYIKFCTDSFDNESLEYLQTQLKRWSVWINHKNRRIYMKRIFVRSFLEYIGNCPVTCYSHKWALKCLENDNLDKNGPKKYTHLYPQIIKEYSPDMPSILLCRKYGIPHSSLKAMLKNYNLDFIKTPKKSIIQYDSQSETVWSCLAEIAKKTSFSPSSINACCFGRRKQCGGFKWKFA